MYTENFSSESEIEDKQEKSAEDTEKKALIAELLQIKSKAAEAARDFKQHDNDKNIFASEFSKKHADFNDYQLYHLLIGSTPQGSKFDTEDHEIEDFIRSLELKNMVDSAMHTDEEYFDKLVQLEKELKEKYPDVKDFNKYKLSHLAAGSGLSSLIGGDESEHDLPGGEFEKFIRSLKKSG